MLFAHLLWRIEHGHEQEEYEWTYGNNGWQEQLVFLIENTSRRE